MFITFDYSELIDSSIDYPEIMNNESTDNYYKRVLEYDEKINNLAITNAPKVLANALGIEVINLPPFDVDFDGGSVYITFN